MMWAAWLSGAGALLLASRERRGNEANAVWEAELTNHHYGQQYTMNITVAGVEMPVIPDTGSFSLLVTSKRCGTCPARARAFDYQQAALNGTYDANDDDVTKEKVSFGSGTVLVRLGYADLELGPNEARTALWEIYASDMSMNAVWRGAAFQGIFGLGWKDTDRNETTVLESMGVDQFTFCLGQGKKTPGTLHFNTILPDRPQAFAPVIGENHWGVALSNITVSIDGARKLCSDSKCGALIDSGTSQILLPPTHVVAFKEMIGGVDPHCENWDSLPDLVFELGGHEVRLTKETYAQRLTMGGIPTVKKTDGAKLTFEYTKPKQFCWLTVGSAILIGDHGPVWIFGMPFFRQHLVSFDRDKKQIGFGEPCGAGMDETKGPSSAKELCKTGDLVDEDGNVVPCAEVEAHALVRAEKKTARAVVTSPGLATPF